LNKFFIPSLLSFSRVFMHIEVGRQICYNALVIIDFHTHVFPPEIKNNRTKYIDADPCFASLYSNPTAKIATAEDLLDSMDKEGIDVSVMVNLAWSTPQLCLATNQYILEAAARFPSRLIGFCVVPLRSLEAAITEIERCARQGARGIGELRPDTPLFDLTNEEAMKLLVDIMIKHKLILLTHASEPVGHNYAGKGEVTPGMLYPFITHFPDLTVVCAHWGGGLPFYALMPEVKRALKNVYFDTAASPFLYSPEIYREVSRLVGADKILFGSDYPLMPAGRLLKEIQALEMSEEAKNLILYGNACRLLNIDKEGKA
jgi:predicted TIM-barrel fold metal-dependent hydrolase